MFISLFLLFYLHWNNTDVLSSTFLSINKRWHNSSLRCHFEIKYMFIIIETIQNNGTFCAEYSPAWTQRYWNQNVLIK